MKKVGDGVAERTPEEVIADLNETLTAVWRRAAAIDQWEPLERMKPDERKS